MGDATNLKKEEVVRVEEGEKTSIVKARKKDEKVEMPKGGYAKLGKLLKPQLMLGFTLGVLAAAGNGMMPILFYLFFGRIIDVLTSGGDLLVGVKQTVLGLVAVACAGGASTFVQNAVFVPTGEIMSAKLRKEFFDKALIQEMGFFDKTKTGKLVSNLSEDVSQFQAVWADKVPQFFQFIAQFIGGLILAFVNSWKMSIVMLACFPVIIVAMGYQGKVTTFFTKKISETSENALITAEEVFSSFRTVKSFAGEEKECLRYKNDLSATQSVGIYKGLSYGIGTGLISISIWGTCALAFWFGGSLVINAEISIGELITVFGMMLMASMSIGQALGIIPEVSKALSSLAIIYEVIGREPELPHKGGNKLDKVDGVVEFEEVHFSYPTRPEIHVLKGISFKVTPGQTIALVGASGSGKSTIMGLLERFYDPFQGHVKLDGVDIKTLDPKWLRETIGIVTQEPVLFDTSIAENIAYGVSNATQEEIEEAAKTANAHEFISSLKEGYNTRVGERGVSMSGGQKQRIAIARAVLKNPKILLLDEATSALDTESEKLVQDALNKLMIGRTCLVIAHRLSTIRSANVILVMSKGIIVEQGSHDELLQRQNGVYANLASKQILHEKKRE